MKTKTNNYLELNRIANLEQLAFVDKTHDAELVFGCLLIFRGWIDFNESSVLGLFWISAA